jgi:hypothetical protein
MVWVKTMVQTDVKVDLKSTPYLQLYADSGLKVKSQGLNLKDKNLKLSLLKFKYKSCKVR